jgi:hypothetical protein
MLLLNDRKFIESPFDSEAELEKVVVENYESLFGPSSLYFPKAMIRTKSGFGTIPDGFVVDLAARRWFVVEAELAKHSVWSHIAPQVAKQITATMNPVSRQLLCDFIMEKVKEDPIALEKFDDAGVAVIHIYQTLQNILAGEPIIGMPIDKISGDLAEWANTLRVKVKLWIVRKHVEFGFPDRVMYEIPEEFQPTLETGEDDADSSQQSKYDVTIDTLVDAGLLRENQKLVMQWTPRNGTKQTYDGYVRSGGTIEVQGRPFASPSYAALYALQLSGSTRTTVNGWVSWKTESGLVLAAIREQYLQSKVVDGV